MAFDRSKLGHITANANSWNLWTFQTVDTLAQVLAADYFLTEIKFMNKYDRIHAIVDTDGTPQIVELYISVNDATTITASVVEDPGAALPVNHTANATLTAVLNAERINVFNDADGCTLTLPAATGTGDVYRFAVGVATSGGNCIIKVADATDIMQGAAIVLQDAGDTLVAFETAADSDTITLNGTTTGGKVGDYIELQDIATNLWLVRQCRLVGTGTEATPFSATV